jgi:hypothetical protein
MQHLRQRLQEPLPWRGRSLPRILCAVHRRDAGGSPVGEPVANQPDRLEQALELAARLLPAAGHPQGSGPMSVSWRVL